MHHQVTDCDPEAREYGWPLECVEHHDATGDGEYRCRACGKLWWLDDDGELPEDLTEVPPEEQEKIVGGVARALIRAMEYPTDRFPADGDVVAVAARVGGVVGDAVRRALLNSTDPDLRGEAVWPYRFEPALWVLERALADPDPGVRRAAAHAACYRYGDAGRPALEQLAQDQDARVAEVAREYLRRLEEDAQ